MHIIVKAACGWPQPTSFCLNMENKYCVHDPGFFLYLYTSHSYTSTGYEETCQGNSGIYNWKSSGKTSGIGWVVINLLQIIFPIHVSSGSDSLESLMAFLSSDFSSVFCHIPSNTGRFFVQNYANRYSFAITVLGQSVKFLMCCMMRHYRNKHGTTHQYPPPLPRKKEYCVLKHPFTMTVALKYEIRNLLVKTFHLIYYMTTFLKLIYLHLMSLPHPLGRALKYEYWNLLIKTFHLIYMYYMTTFQKLYFLHLMTLPHPLGRTGHFPACLVLQDVIMMMSYIRSRDCDVTAPHCGWCYEWCYGRCHYSRTLVFPLLKFLINFVLLIVNKTNIYII